MTTYTDRQKACIAALRACVDVMLHNGVPTDKDHPARVALTMAESALESTSPITGFSEPDGGADVRGDAIYQTGWRTPETVWGDVDKATYDTYTEFGYTRRRVLYAEPSQPAAPADELPIKVSDELHPDTAKLVRRFARALANKLLAAQRKYGYGASWTADDWQDKCRADLMNHIAKGDPRDVAAYCAFMWHHDWSTAAPPTAAQGATLTDEQIIERCKAAGIKWIPPELPDDCDYEMGFPGSFDMVSMDEMRALLAAAKPVSVDAQAAAVSDPCVHPSVCPFSYWEESHYECSKCNIGGAADTAAVSVDAGGDLQDEIERLTAIINTPHTDDFWKAVSIEAEHQRQRWPSEQDAGKTPADWFWLVGYLGGKALHAHASGNVEKAEHHIITTAAACANWHLAVFGKTNMRPGIETPPTESTGEPTL